MSSTRHEPKIAPVATDGYESGSQVRMISETTDLSSRHKLMRDLKQACSANTESNHLIYVRVSNLSSYQALYGSQILIELLNQFTTKLSTLSDLVDIYRLRTGEFAILINREYDVEHFNATASLIIDLYQNSVKNTGFLYGNDITIGIYPKISPTTPENVIDIAARVCRFAQQKEGRSVAIYEGEEKRTVDRHFYIERELGNAISNNALSVKFQPIVCAAQHKVVSFEALVRWRASDIGEIYPDEFVGVAEKKGLIGDLGRFVFQKACAFIQEYNATHQRQTRVNVNVSVLQLLNNQFPEELKSMAEQYQVNCHQIVLELTETIILDGNQHAVDQLNQLKQYGFLLALDDFGAGYSSLNSFFDLPLAQIKIDKSTAWRSFENPATFEYLTFVVQLCNSYSVDIVVEGIENADMQRVFTNMGVAYLQGYWFSKPLCLANASHYTQV